MLHDKLKLKSEIGIQSGAFEHPADAIFLSGVPNQENLLFKTSLKSSNESTLVMLSFLKINALS